MKLSVIVITVAVMSAWIGVSEAQQAGTVKRLHVLDCGRLHLQDGGRVSPAGAGAPIDLLDSCYLIQTAHGYLLWETGAPDGLVAQPAPGGTPLVLSRTETLLSQLAELDVEPSDLRYVAISHTHGDHAGNVDLFPEVTLLIQKAEYEAAFAPDRKQPALLAEPPRGAGGGRPGRIWRWLRDPHFDSGTYVRPSVVARQPGGDGLGRLGR